MTRILLVEDSQIDQTLVSKVLSNHGAEVRIAANGEAALEILRTEKFQMILLDLGLPDMDGLQLFSKVQSMIDVEEVPVIFLTGKEDVTAKVTAFSLGAEDYLVKPVNPLELRARVEARLRKKSQSGKTKEIIQRGSLRIHLGFQLAEVVSATGSKEAKRLELTPKEFKLLFHLASNEGRIYSRDQLLDTVWGGAVHVGDRTVDTHICSLRKKLGDLSGCIQSVPGSGYRFVAPSAKSEAA